MTQSQYSQAPREALTDAIIDAKVRKNLTFEQINEGTGLSLAFVTAALLGQHPLPADAAKVVADKLELRHDAVRELQTIRLRHSSAGPERQTIPLRNSIPGGVPTDPTTYRFYEMILVYGSTLKALVHEKLG